MSKKSHPGDGSHGKGVKGMRTPFDGVFTPRASQRTTPAKQSSKPAEAAGATTDDEQ